MIQHVTREVPPSTLDACIAFYAKLGFERVPEPAGLTSRAVWLDDGHEVEPRRQHWGSPRSYVRDPARNLVELMAWPPDHLPVRQE
jgi:hypothetical protein